jgi:hypothetical protein
MLEIRARMSRTAIVASLAVAAAVVLAATNARSPERTLLGEPVKVGQGTARMFVDVAPDGAPSTIGIALTGAALQDLPARMNSTSRCFDKDGDRHLAHGECLGDYQSTLAMPNEAARFNLPVSWATVNWNPEGHMHPAPPVWGAAHFDFHFFMVEPAVINSIRPGSCGEIIDCDDFVKARMPLPTEQQAADYIDVGAAVTAMGNHLIDSKDPELADPSLGFTRTFIYGAYAGRMIFLEPMVSHAYLTSRPDACRPIKAPQAWPSSAYYPTRYCVRHDAPTATYRITLEGLVLRGAREPIEGTR